VQSNACSTSTVDRPLGVYHYPFGDPIGAILTMFGLAPTISIAVGGRVPSGLGGGHVPTLGLRSGWSRSRPYGVNRTS
jgi:hypothetical protein